MTVPTPGLAGTSQWEVPARLARSWLLVSALRLEQGESPADAVVIDLEDAVPGSQKQQARDAAVGWLAGGRGWVRVNDATSEHWGADLAAVGTCDGMSGIMLAKVESAAQISDTASLLPAGTRIIALIESARGLEAASEIAHESATFRLAFGSGDFRRDTGVGDDPLALAYARSRLVVASAAAGIPGPIDGPAVTDSTDDLLAAAVHARTMGLTGKLTLRQEQAAHINESLSPTEAELTWARDTIDRAHEAVDGSYLPMLARARSLVALASAYGLVLR